MKKVVENAATRDRGATCVHRGVYLRSETAERCGIRGQRIKIFQCQHPDLINADKSFSECARIRFCHNQTARSCLICKKHATTKNP